MLLSKSSIDFSRSDDLVGFLMWRVTGLWQKKVNALLKSYGLTHAQFLVLDALVWLSQEKEKVAQVDIARYAEIDPMMVSNLSRMLEKKEYIERVNNKEDTRANSLKITSKGAFVYKKTQPEVGKFDANFFSESKISVKQLTAYLTALTEDR